VLADGRYFQVKELACHDGSPYPEYYAGRLVTLMQLLDACRELYGGPLVVVSGYRSPAYNKRLAQDSAAHQVASGSQHIQGNAADLRPAGGDSHRLFNLVMAAYRQGKLPMLGGIGYYPESNWCHVDTHRAEDGHLRQWLGR
jgi:uncharacterized protein YcbK (DUF882 family)